MATLGRPRQFDRDEALERAMQQFWTHGYEATGLRELLPAMQIGRQSLYDTFGSKQQLYLAAVRHYYARQTKELLATLHGGGPAVERIRRTMKQVADGVTDGCCRGCLLTNTLVEAAPHDAEIARASRQMLATLEGAFRQVVSDAAAAGELPKDVRPRAIARHLICTLQGLAVMGKAAVSRAAVKDILSVALSVLER